MSGRERRALFLDVVAEADALARRAADQAGERVLELPALRREGLRALVRTLRAEAASRLTLHVHDLGKQSRWVSLCALALLARAGERRILAKGGEERALGWGSFIVRELPFALRRARARAATLRRVRWLARRLPEARVARAVEPSRVLFVRSDLGPPLVAGGSLAHIEGVVSGLRGAGVTVDLITPTPVRGFDPGAVGVTLLPPDPGHELSVELPPLAYNLEQLPAIAERLRRRPVDLIYARHALGAFAAAIAAGEAGLPFVVEYNGPEVWIARNWGAARRELPLFEELERRVLRAADLVVAVSEPLRKPLHEAGVPEERILVQPNGVVPERFDPAVHAEAGARRRAAWGVEPGGTVVGFVGTFGPWHGAELLAEAARGLASEPGMLFVFAGAGPRAAATERLFVEAGLAGRARLVGRVAPDEIPEILAGIDVAVTPQVPNADGTPFFGSPTKLFEYMAAGRAIVASELDQLGEVIEHDVSGWLVPPNDPRALAAALAALAADPEKRRQLGNAARETALARYSWRAHVGAILARLAVPKEGV